MRRYGLVLLVLAACSDPSPDERVRTVCDAIATHFCDGAKACACPSATDAGACAKSRSDSCVAGLLPKVQADLAAGRAAVDDAALKDCTAAIDALAPSCRAPGSERLPAACSRTIVDVAKPDTACSVQGSGLAFCAAGAGSCVSEGDAKVCRALPGTGEACRSGSCSGALVCDNNVCVPASGAGGSCTTATGCGPGLACLAGNTCGAPLSSGAACERALQCASGLSCDTGACAPALPLGAECNSLVACGAGRSCVRAPETRRCTDPAKENEPCDATDECAEGLVCDPQVHACSGGPKEGEACPDHVCAAGLTCADEDQTCRKLPKKDETCLAGDRFCAPGFGCRESDDTCQEGGGDGAACLLNPPEYVCAPGFGCDFGASASICRPLAGAGAACETDRTCATGFFCGDGTCRAKEGEGAACPLGSECGAGLFCSIAEKTCRKIPVRDEPCEFTCAPGLACRGKGGRCAASFCAMR